MAVDNLNKMEDEFDALFGGSNNNNNNDLVKQQCCDPVNKSLQIFLLLVFLI